MNAFLDVSHLHGMHLYSRVNVLLIALSIVTAVYLLFTRLLSPKLCAPYVGFKWIWEPRWLAGLRFTQNGLQYLLEGCQKFPDKPFRIARNDTDIVVIPNRFVDELRSKPEHEVSAIEAHMKNLLGKYSTIEILHEGILHNHALQTKLTPRLGALIGDIESELLFAINKEIPPKLDQWTSLSIHRILLRLVARISARVFVGLPTCRDEEWLDLSVRFTENVFITLAILRRVPPWLRPLVAPLIPRYWAIQRDLGAAKRIIAPVVRQRYMNSRSNSTEKQPEDLLQWMMEMANEHDGQPDKLAHRQLVLSLAAIHTTTVAAAHAIYDLCVHPGYMETLRSEAVEAVAETGGWQKTTLTKLRELDSFMKESQRLSPPSLLSFQRVIMKPMYLSDGTFLPRGTHISVPAAEILNGNEYDATFDGKRFLKRRESAIGESHKHQFATTDRASLHFGHGKYACPGRFFAANEIKIILAHLLIDYEFRLPTGKSRPPMFTLDEVFMVDPSAQIRMRKRSSHVK